MKKYLYPLILILAVVACKQKSADNAETKTTIKQGEKGKFHYTDSIFYRYAAYLKSLDMKAAISAAKAATKYVELFKGKDQQVCDTAFVIFNKFYADMAESLQQVNEKDAIDLDKYYGYIPPKPMPANVIAYINDLKQNGFDLVAEEGDVYVGQDRDFVAKYFYGLVSAVMEEYLVQVNKENKQVYLEDGELSITTDELVERTVWWEKFEKAHPDFIWRNEVSATKKEYQFVLLVGSDNSPVFMTGDNKPDGRFLRSYAYLAKKYPDTETWKLVKPYCDLILKGDYAKAIECVDNYQKNGVFKVDK